MEKMHGWSCLKLRYDLTMCSPYIFHMQESRMPISELGLKDRKQKQATGSTSPVELLGGKAEDDLDLW